MLGKMTVDDLEEVCAVDLRAFNRTNRYGGGMSQRRRDLLESYLEPPGGGLVYRVEERIAGFAFYHNWGSYGYLGPVAVDPAFAQKNTAVDLLEAARTYLTGKKVRLLGIEAVPEDGPSLDLYARVSFQLTGLGLILAKDMSGGESRIPPVPVRDMGLVRQVADKVLSGLDPSREITVLHDMGLGELFVEENGFVFCQPGGAREGTGSVGIIRILMASPCARARETGYLLEIAEAYFRAVGVVQAVLTLPADQMHWLKFLMDRNWRIISASIRAFWPAEQPMHRGTAFYSCLG